MMFLVFLLLLFVGARAKHDGLIINITSAPTEAETTIAHEGTDIKLLTELERETFHLTEDSLKEAVKTLSHEKPTEGFIQTVSSGAENDIYKMNNRRQVKRHFRIKSIKIANVTTGVEKQQEVDDLRSTSTTEGSTRDLHLYRNCSYFHSAHRWSGNVDVSAKVWYRFSEQLTFYSEVGAIQHANDFQIKHYSETAASIYLNPGQTAKFSVFANTVTININVVYETGLSGDVIVRYTNKHNGKEFQSYDVNRLLRTLFMTTEVETHELVTISYVKDYFVKVVDIATGKDIPYSNLVHRTIQDYVSVDNGSHWTMYHLPNQAFVGKSVFSLSSILILSFVITYSFN